MKIDIREHSGEGPSNKKFCELHILDDGRAMLETKGKKIDAVIELDDFLRQIPNEYLKKYY